MMRSHSNLGMALVSLAVAMNTVAGTTPSSSRSSGMSAGVSKSSSPAKPANSGNIPKYRPVASPAKDTARLARRSLLGEDGPTPSSHVTQLIQERESTGPGWLGTAFLISLLSRHDLSATDRDWIQNRIDTLKSHGEISEPEPFLPAVSPTIALTFTGIASSLVVGVPAEIRITAVDHRNQPVPVACTLPAVATTTAGMRASFHWTPQSAGVLLLDCKAAGKQERRLVRIAEKLQ